MGGTVLLASYLRNKAQFLVKTTLLLRYGSASICKQPASATGFARKPKAFRLVTWAAAIFEADPINGRAEFIAHVERRLRSFGKQPDGAEE